MRWRMPTIRECTDAYCVRADRPAGMHARATDLLPIERPQTAGHMHMICTGYHTVAKRFTKRAGFFHKPVGLPKLSGHGFS